jgi:outer membrane receptor protein involved in Fe transport
VATTEAQIFYHREDFHFALTGFHSDQHELILRLPTATPPLATFENQGRVRFQGIELEGRYSFTKATYLTGSMLYAEDENQAGVAKVTPVSETMLKLGVAHRWASGHSAGIFNSFFDEPVDVTGLAGPNPEPEAVNLLTANLVLNLSRLAGAEGSTNVFLKLHGVNLLDEEVWFPEYVRREINALPAHSGAAVYAEVEISF